jgi:hypothetical protein
MNIAKPIDPKNSRQDGSPLAVISRTQKFLSHFPILPVAASMFFAMAFFANALQIGKIKKQKLDLFVICAGQKRRDMIDILA